MTDRIDILFVIALVALLILGGCADKRGNATVQPCGSGALFCIYG